VTVKNDITLDIFAISSVHKESQYIG